MSGTNDDALQLNLGITSPSHRNQFLFSDHYLDNLLPQDRRWQEALPQARAFLGWLQERYTQERDQLGKYKESQLEDHWFRPILQELGHTFEGQASVPGLDTAVKVPDYVFFSDEAARQTAVSGQRTDEYTAGALAIGEVKAWQVPLGKKLKGGSPSFDDQNPSYQIDYYLKTTGLDWGILSNGRHWRLVHRDSSHRLNIYYEVDLVDLLRRGDAGPLRYFTLFFRQAAFRPDAHGRLFLDEALAASNAYAVALEEDLQQNVYQALEWLMQGFLDLKANNLSRDDLQAVYDNSLYLLYRLLFILYAESRGLLPLAHEEYREHYSLHDIKNDIAAGNAPTAPTTTVFWSRVQTLFHIINGDDEALNRHLDVPRYNGGLFNPDLHPFLEEKKVGDRALVKAIDLLSRRQTPAGLEFADYRTLGVRQLGSIYEGLLEYQPRLAAEPMVAVRQGKREQWLPAAEAPQEATIAERRKADEAYLTTDRGERKATGSYYTPQYIVEYIVENTLGPLVEEATERVRQRGQQAGSKPEKEAVAQSLVGEILDLKVLDPAMGSGHFLVEATDYLAIALATDPYVAAEATPEEDVTYWKRRVVERCIYGVDKNPLAVELAKLSLWLATVAADQPLSFLDHHLKCGDSLIGARVDDLGWAPPVVLSKKAQKQLEKQKAGQMNLFQYRLSQQLPVVMGKILEITEKESDSYETVQAKEAADEAVRQLKAPFQAVANLWTSAYFGHDFSPAAYGEAVDAIGQPSQLLTMPAVQRAQEINEGRNFFHWELAFPEVFYDQNGQPLGETAGFDAVVGNPPYIRAETADKEQRNYIMQSDQFDFAWGRFDVYIIFVEQAIKLTKDAGMFAFIVPAAILTINYAEKLRGWLLKQKTVTKILDARSEDVFPGVGVSPTILIIRNLVAETKHKIQVESLQRFKKGEFLKEIPQEWFSKLSGQSVQLDLEAEDLSVKLRIDSVSAPLARYLFFTTGLVGHNSRTGESVDRLIHSRQINVTCKPYIEAKEWEGRYSWLKPERFIEYKPDEMHRPKFPELFESPKLLVQRISSSTHIPVTLDDQGVYVNHVINCCVRASDVIHLGSRLNYDVTSFDVESPYALAYFLSLAASKLLGFYHNKFLSPGVDIFPETLRQLPIREIQFSTSTEDRSDLIKKGQKLYQRYCQKDDLACVTGFVDHELEQGRRDVVHDLLAFLAQEMIDMNKARQQVAEDFWLDLEGVTDADTFDTLRHRGKWESSLWKAEACRPFVAQDSRSTRHLNESLGWNEDCFKAFVKMLADNVDHLSALVRVYRQHHPGYAALIGRLAATDHLIDQIVYRLYGLTEEEIAIVESET